MDNSNKKKIIKILIHIIILIIVAGIWMIKNTGKELKNDDKKVVQNNEGDNNPDFDFDVTEELDMEKLKEYGLPILIDFCSDGCEPCRRIHPILVKLNNELKGKAIIKYVDVDKYQNVAADYPIRVVPTQVLFDSDGNPFNSENAEELQLTMYYLRETEEHALTVHEGFMTEEDLLTLLKEMGLEND